MALPRGPSITSPEQGVELQPFWGAEINTSTERAAILIHRQPEAMQSSTKMPPAAFVACPDGVGVEGEVRLGSFGYVPLALETDPSTPTMALAVVAWGGSASVGAHRGSSRPRHSGFTTGQWLSG